MEKGGIHHPHLQHRRNHGFLNSGGNSWTLSPTFDLNPNPSPGTKYLATAIDEADTTASIETLMSVTPLFRLDEEGAIGLLGQVLISTGRWKQAAMDHNIAKAEIERMSAAFEHDQTEAAGALTGR